MIARVCGGRDGRGMPAAVQAAIRRPAGGAVSIIWAGWGPRGWLRCPPMGEIFHIADRAVWDAVRADGGPYEMSTRDRTLAEEGFIHCCGSEEQLAGVLHRYYGDVAAEDLVLLVIDPTGLDVRHEPVGEDTFPHVYGPLPISAVIDVRSVPKTR